MLVEPTFRFDPHTQREVLDNPADAHAWVAHLESIGIAGDPMRVVWLRILGELDEAHTLGWRVLHRAGGPQQSSQIASMALPLSAVTAAVRLGHVVQWQKQFDLAHTLIDMAVHTLESVEALSEDSAYADYLLPFAYQHRARCFFDEGRYPQALAASQRAYDLRVSAGVPEDQVLSSSGLIAAVLPLLAKST